jgi:uncharacterized membrane protein
MSCWSFEGSGMGWSMGWGVLWVILLVFIGFFLYTMRRPGYGFGMESPTEIAKRRLAEGEITSEEYDNIIKKIK